MLSGCDTNSTPSSNDVTAQITKQGVGDRWGFFQVSDSEAASYRFGVKPADAAAPTKSEMEGDINTKIYDVDTTPINIILATEMGTPLFAFFSGKTDDASAQAMWTDTDLSVTGANIMRGNDEFSARKSLLKPSTAYKIYGLKTGSSTVGELLEFSTLPIDLTAQSSTLELLDTNNILMNQTITFHEANWEIFPIQYTLPLSSTSFVACNIHSNSAVYASEGKLNLNPAFFPKSYPEFFFYAGSPADYNNSSRLLSLRGLFVARKGKGDAFLLGFSHSSSLTPLNFNPTINYQRSSSNGG